VSLSPLLDSLLNWLVRSLHVLGAALWVGGYAVLALVILPALARYPQEPILRLAQAATRLLNVAGTLTIVGGLILVTRSRGYGFLLAGEWGGIVIGAILVAVVLMAVGDGALRRALGRVGAGDGGAAAAARRWALVGLALAVVALAMMTRAPYART
jgi:putative copper export protein